MSWSVVIVIVVVVVVVVAEYLRQLLTYPSGF